MNLEIRFRALDDARFLEITHPGHRFTVVAAQCYCLDQLSSIAVKVLRDGVCVTIE